MDYFQFRQKNSVWPRGGV